MIQDQILVPCVHNSDCKTILSVTKFTVRLFSWTFWQQDGYSTYSPGANDFEIGLKHVYNSLIHYCVSLFHVYEGHTTHDLNGSWSMKRIIAKVMYSKYIIKNFGVYLIIFNVLNSAFAVRNSHSSLLHYLTASASLDNLPHLIHCWPLNFFHFPSSVILFSQKLFSEESFFWSYLQCLFWSAHLWLYHFHGHLRQLYFAVSNVDPGKVGTATFSGSGFTNSTALHRGFAAIHLLIRLR